MATSIPPTDEVSEADTKITDNTNSKKSVRELQLEQENARLQAEIEAMKETHTQAIAKLTQDLHATNIANQERDQKMNALQAALEELLSTKSPARKQAKTNVKYPKPSPLTKSAPNNPLATPDRSHQISQAPQSPPKINPRLDLHQEPPMEGING